MPKVARYLKDNAQGEDGRDDLGQQRLRQGRARHDHARRSRRRASRSPPTSRPTRARSTSRARCCKAKQSNADALFVYTNEEESARALRELRKQGYDKPIVGETTLTSQKVIELAGDAANGAVAHVGLTADAPQPRDQGVRRRSSRRNTSTRATTTAEGLQRRCTWSRRSPRRSASSIRKAFANGDARREDLGQGHTRACCSTCVRQATATSTARAS